MHNRHLPPEICENQIWKDQGRNCQRNKLINNVIMHWVMDLLEVAATLVGLNSKHCRVDHILTNKNGKRKMVQLTTLVYQIPIRNNRSMMDLAAINSKEVLAVAIPTVLGTSRTETTGAARKSKSNQNLNHVSKGLVSLWANLVNK